MYVQPENLLVDVDPSRTVPLLKLIDFGDARHIYDDTYIHRVMGSAEFAAPELITGHPASLLSDIWSASVVHFHVRSWMSLYVNFLLSAFLSYLEFRCTLTVRVC